MTIEELYQKYKRLMFATAGKFTDDPENRADIVQSALERLCRARAAPGGEARQFSAGYLVCTVRSAAIDFLRRERRETEGRVPLEAPEETPAEDPALTALLSASDRGRRLWAVWPQLSEEDRLLLEGKYILELTDRELAKLLGCKPDSVRMKLTRARRRALKRLTEGGEDDDQT